MGTRNVLDIMREGQEKTLLTLPLLEKQMAGTITPNESARLAMLNGNLLALVKEAQAQGVGVGVGTGLGQVPVTAEDDEDDELWDEDEEFEDQQPW